MSGEALYVTLRVPDPTALTALATLQSLGARAPVALERGRLWFHRSSGAAPSGASPDGWVWERAGDGAALGDPAAVWLNPNKERGYVWQAEACPWLRPAAGEEAWVLVRERGGHPEAPLTRALREGLARSSGRLAVLLESVAEDAGRLASALLWRLWYSAPAPDVVALAEAAAVVRTSRQGLLVHPHSQAHRTVRPPDRLDQLETLLQQLRNEAR